MSFQTIIDGATAISIDKNPVVSQTITRDQTVRQTSRGGAIYRFTVTPNPALKYTDYRWLIADLEEAKIGSQTISINKTGHSWITGYGGGLTSQQIDALTFVYTSAQKAVNPRQVGISNLPSVNANTVIFQPGDLIQSANSVFPYTVTSKVLRGTDTYVMAPIHRVCLDTPSATYYDAKVGQQVSWRVVMTKMPSWSIDGDRLIKWNGDFEFYESLL
jgi:hypothetical protein